LLTLDIVVVFFAFLLVDSPGRFSRSPTEQKRSGARRCLSHRQQESSSWEPWMEANSCCNNLLDDLARGKC